MSGILWRKQIIAKPHKIPFLILVIHIFLVLACKTLCPVIINSPLIPVPRILPSTFRCFSLHFNFNLTKGLFSFIRSSTITFSLIINLYLHQVPPAHINLLFAISLTICLAKFISRYVKLLCFIIYLFFY